MKQKKGIDSKLRELREGKAVAAATATAATAEELARLRSQVNIAVFLMVKNEEKRIKVSLDSVKDAVRSVVIFDTGSTDNTVQVLQEWCKEHSLPLRLKQGTFVDFSTSRNEGLAFANTFEDIEYLLLLDSNDELRNPKELLELCIAARGKPQTGFHVTQEWLWGSGANGQTSTTKYQNVRIIKTRSNWWYSGVVHEYLNRFVPNDDGGRKEIIDEKHLFMATHITIFQDRIADEGKSQPRFAKDKELLLREIQKDPNDSRSMFYLAQSCECLGQAEDALYYYRLRSQQAGYEDERFHAFVRGGDNATRLNHDVFEVMKWYLKAYHHSKRAEPLIKIGNIFQTLKDHKMACMFYREASDLEFPEARLFVDNNSYEFERHFRLGISGYWGGRLHEGKMGCLRAIGTGKLTELNQSNLKFYQDKEKELAKANRSQYILERVRERLELEPTAPWEQVNKWAIAEWEKAVRPQ